MPLICIFQKIYRMRQSIISSKAGFSLSLQHWLKMAVAEKCIFCHEHQLIFYSSTLILFAFFNQICIITPWFHLNDAFFNTSLECFVFFKTNIVDVTDALMDFDDFKNKQKNVWSNVFWHVKLCIFARCIH